MTSTKNTLIKYKKYILYNKRGTGHKHQMDNFKTNKKQLQK